MLQRFNDELFMVSQDGEEQMDRYLVFVKEFLELLLERKEAHFGGKPWMRTRRERNRGYKTPDHASEVETVAS